MSTARVPLRTALPFPNIAAMNTSFPQGKQYFPQLARFPGDSEARVGSRQEILDLAKRRGYMCRQGVDYDPPKEDKPPRKYRVAPDLVERHFRRETAGRHLNPEQAREAKAELADRLAGNCCPA